MPEYEVHQTFAREQVVRVTAQNDDEAVQKAQQGHGEIVTDLGAPYLLVTSHVQRAMTEPGGTSTQQNGGER